VGYSGHTPSGEHGRQRRSMHACLSRGQPIALGNICEEAV
jgi:hypothetical protein